MEKKNHIKIGLFNGPSIENTLKYKKIKKS
jgi:hypothetical protein